MCIICTQWEMYRDLADLRSMLVKARQEKYPITDEHLDELEQLLHKMERTEEEMEAWGKWWHKD